MSTLRLFVGDAAATGLPDQSVNLVVESPPYTDRRTYGIGATRHVAEWVEWFLPVVKEGLRVSTGPVLAVVNGCVKGGRYQPAVEGLIWEAFKAGIACEHPLIWSKNAAPNRRDWWCNGFEYVVAFHHGDGRARHWDWASIATPQKYADGGAFRQRAVTGERKLQPKRARRALAAPYDIIRATVGGGQMGHPLAHENEAPFPESLVAPLVRALCPVGGTVLDRFCGSGTTLAVAVKEGRSAIGMDIRPSQIDLANRRLAGLQGLLVSEGVCGEVEPGIASVARELGEGVAA